MVRPWRMFVFIFFTSWKRQEGKNHHQLPVFNCADKKSENHINSRLHFLQLKFGALVVLHIHIYWKLWIKTHSYLCKRMGSRIIQRKEATKFLSPHCTLHHPTVHCIGSSVFSGSFGKMKTGFLNFSLVDFLATPIFFKAKLEKFKMLLSARELIYN
jgi:hypothetical protein